MSPGARRLLEEACRLPPDEREWLAESLLIALGPEAEVTAAWDAEIKRRLDEIDSGAGATISHGEVMRETEDQLRQLREIPRRKVSSKG